MEPQPMKPIQHIRIDAIGPADRIESRLDRGEADNDHHTKK